ncbi:bifunctional nicotinamidase/pyrazinamidase, partial [Salmonella enterica subsp. enterica serovar Infantis]
GAALQPQHKQQSIEASIYKGEKPQIYIYSAFFVNQHRQKNTLHNSHREHDVTELIVMGLSTDYCEKLTVLHAIEIR